MRPFLTSLASCAALALAAAEPALAQEPPAAGAGDAPRLLTIVTSDHPEVQGMAFVLTLQSLQAGSEARVLLCGPGGDLALADGERTALKPRDLAPQDLMASLMEQGVTVEVCALYLPNRQAEAADLIEGVGVARPPDIAAWIVAEDSKLLNF